MAELVVGKQLGGRYEIVRRLGATGNGYVDVRVFDDGANITLMADVVVSSNNNWNAQGTGWVRLTAPDGSIFNANNSDILASGGHLFLKARNAIGTETARRPTSVSSSSNAWPRLLVRARSARKSASAVIVFGALVIASRRHQLEVLAIGKKKN